MVGAMPRLSPTYRVNYEEWRLSSLVYRTALQIAHIFNILTVHPSLHCQLTNTSRAHRLDYQYAVEGRLDYQYP